VKFIALAATLLAGSASAFTPSVNGRASTAIAAEKSQSLPFMNRPALLDGSMAGDVGFDPLGLSNIDDVGIDLYWLREAEIKHCRVAMMAVAGFLQVELFGPAIGCEAATAKCQTDAFWQIWNSHPQYIAAALLFITIIEAVSGIAATSGRESGDRAPGDFGLDPLGYMKGDPAKAARLQAQEIANGRLAMWAASGLIMQGCANHMGGVEAMQASLNANMF
jgi:light-harvesting complex I chlorophyll a/b binding protein 1